jgi:uncharacterized membrane protein YphA (DoxX/SURF4 family)
MAARRAGSESVGWPSVKGFVAPNFASGVIPARGARGSARPLREGLSMGGLKEFWARIEKNRDLCFDLMRVYLGLGLFVKGVQFISDRTFLLNALQRSDTLEFRFDFISTFLAHYIPLAHLGGGLLLAAGLMTRTSTLFQLPVLFGAVFLIYAEEGVLTHNQDFEFTALVLFLLILILFHGAGRLSVDHYLRTH